MMYNAYVFVSLLVLFAYIYVGYWSFPQVDDFTSAYLVIQKGALGCAAFRYQTSSGRFALCFVARIVSPAFPYYTNLVIMVSLALFAISLVLILRRLNSGDAKIACIDIAFLFLALPRGVKQQDFYWLAGNVGYTLPITITAFTIAFLHYPVRQEYEKLVLLAIFLLFVFVGGLGEAFPAAFILLICGYLTSLYPQCPPHLKRWLAVLLGISIGLCIDVLAPGNYLRWHRVTRGHAPDVFVTAQRTLHAIYNNASFFVAILSYGFIRAYFKHPRMCAFVTKRQMLWCAGISFTATYVAYYAVFYGYNSPVIIARTLLAPLVLLFITSLCLTDWLARAYPVSYLATPILIILALPLPKQGFNDLVRGLRQGQQLREVAAAQWDAAYLAQREMPQLSIVVPGIPHHDSILFFDTITRSEKNWRNRCFARYFGLSTVRAF